MIRERMNGIQGCCPVCGSDKLNYDSVQDCDIGVCYPWVCEDCRSAGKECYSIDFDSHQDVYVADGYLLQEQVDAALKCLIDNGIDKDESATVLQALCYILMDKEIDDMLEDKYEN